MSAAITKYEQPTDEAIEIALVEGDLSRLSSAQRRQYYLRVCDSVGLNPLTKPFEYLRLNGRMLLYATKSCTDQLRAIHGISLTIVRREVSNGICEVTARATDARGREDTDVGAVFVDGLRGEALANAVMKAHTKAKRRVTLSISGLGLLDEAEVESIQGAERVRDDEVPAPPQLAAAKTPSVPPPAAPKSQLHNVLRAQLIGAPSLEALKATWADVLKASKAQHVSLAERAALQDVKDERKKALEAPPPPDYATAAQDALGDNELPASYGGPAQTEEACMFCEAGFAAGEERIEHTDRDGVVGWRHNDCTAFEHR